MRWWRLAARQEKRNDAFKRQLHGHEFRVVPVDAVQLPPHRRLWSAPSTSPGIGAVFTLCLPIQFKLCHLSAPNYRIRRGRRSFRCQNTFYRQTKAGGHLCSSS